MNEWMTELTGDWLFTTSGHSSIIREGNQIRYIFLRFSPLFLFLEKCNVKKTIPMGNFCGIYLRNQMMQRQLSVCSYWVNIIIFDRCFKQILKNISFVLEPWTRYFVYVNALNVCITGLQVFLVSHWAYFLGELNCVGSLVCMQLLSPWLPSRLMSSLIEK